MHLKYLIFLYIVNENITRLIQSNQECSDKINSLLLQLQGNFLMQKYIVYNSNNTQIIFFL